MSKLDLNKSWNYADAIESKDHIIIEEKYTN